MVICQQGRFRYNCLSQGITSASDLFNMVSDGNSRFDEFWRSSLKNMDDVLFAGRNLEDLKLKMETFLEFCKKKNIKVKPSKFRVASSVEFGVCIGRFGINRTKKQKNTCLRTAEETNL